MIKKCVAYRGAFFDCSRRIINFKIYRVCSKMSFNAGS